jgi:hypothetical protein
MKNSSSARAQKIQNFFENKKKIRNYLTNSVIKKKSILYLT